MKKLNIIQQISQPNKTKSSLVHYLVAILTVAITTELTSLSPILVEKSPYMMFYAAVTFTAWYGGMWPAILATIASAFAANYFFIHPINALTLGWSDAVQVAVFIQVSLLSSSLNEARKRNIEILLAGQELFQSFMNNSPTLTFMKDEQGRYIYINQKMETLSNRKQVEWIGKTDFDIWPEPIAKEFYKYDCAARKEGKTLENIETLHLNNQPYHWMTFRFPFMDTSGRCLLAGISIDITERKAIEQRLEKTLQDLTTAKIEWESTVNAFPEIIFLIDNHKNILRANQAFERWKLGELSSIYNQNFHKALHPSCNLLSCYLEKMLDESLQENKTGYYLEREIQDDILGRYLSVTITSIQTLQSLAEETNKDKRLEQNFVLVLRDITKLHALQQASKRRTRFEAMEYLLGRLAHQISNPLAAMKTTAQVWLRNFDKLNTSKQSEYLNKIIDRTNHLESIVNSILTGQGWKIHNISPIAVTDILKLVQTSFEDQMQVNKLSFRITNSVNSYINLLADPKAIEEVFAIVLKNAIDACKAGDEITIKAVTKENTVLFFISDKGSGISKSNLEHVFSPFYTTKSKGSGIGLAHASLLMQQMQGQIEIESTEGLGTEVTLTFLKENMAHNLIKEKQIENSKAY